YQHANEIPVDLKAIDITSSSSSVIQPVPSKVATVSKRPSKISHLFSWTLRLLFLALIIFCAWQLWKITSTEPVRRLIINADAELDISGNSMLTISPQGENVIYVGRQNGETKLFLRSLDKFEALPIQGTEGARSPFFSHDGKWIGFFANGNLKKVSILGGVPVTLTATNIFFGASWAANDTIYFSAGQSNENNCLLFQISANGSAAKVLTQPQDSLEFVRHCFPQILPGNKALIFTRLPKQSDNPDEGVIEVLDLHSGKRQKILQGGIYARYINTGHIVAAWSGGLFAVPFNLKKLEVTGPTVPVLNKILLNNELIPNFAFSKDGTLIYAPVEKGSQKKQIISMNRDGEKQDVFDLRRDFYHISFSPDESKIAVTVGRENAQVWIIHPVKQEFSQFTFEGSNSFPIWTPDGKHITYSSNRNGSSNIYMKAIKAETAEVQLTSGDNRQLPTSWSADGTVLAFCEDHPDSNLDIMLLKFDSDTTVQSLISTRFNEQEAKFSPNGKWVAYTSDKSGRNEIYVQSYSGDAAPVRVSEKGGSSPIWHPNSQRLYFRQRNTLMSVSIKTKPVFEADKPEEMFKMANRFEYYTISPGGEQFVFVVEEQAQSIKHFNIVLNWDEELKQQVDSGKRIFGLKVWW
ncbi:MAG: hypothetical protein ACE5FF_14550, partial [Saprospiraceae bacterium]